MSIFENLDGFDWDEYNRYKIFDKYGISSEVAESVFMGDKYVVFDDILHSSEERRFAIIGNTKNLELLIVTFTIRVGKIRVISARRTNKNEKLFYEQALKYKKSQTKN